VKREGHQGQGFLSYLTCSVPSEMSFNLPKYFPFSSSELRPLLSVSSVVRGNQVTGFWHGNGGCSDAYLQASIKPSGHQPSLSISICDRRERNLAGNQQRKWAAQRPLPWMPLLATTEQESFVVLNSGFRIGRALCPP
jgi:hypothetical protein